MPRTKTIARRSSYSLLTILSLWLALTALIFCNAACDSSPPPAAKPAPSRQSAHDLHEQADQLDRMLGDSAAPVTLPPGHPPLAASSQPAGLPPSHPPIGSSDSPSTPPESSLTYDAPAEWTKLPVTNPIRKAEFLLPRAPGDPDDGRLIVYYFGPNQGGSITANLQRWRGMFTTPDGKPIPDEAVQHATFEANGLKTTLMDIAGRYNDPMGGMHAHAAVDADMRMLAAMIESPDGPWFFKAVGPPATMTQHREAFLRLLNSAKR